MAESIAALAVIGASILWWWLRRRSEPLEQHRERYEQASKDIASQDSKAATANSVADLDELDRLRLQNRSRGSE